MRVVGAFFSSVFAWVLINPCVCLYFLFLRYHPTTLLPQAIILNLVGLALAFGCLNLGRRATFWLRRLYFTFLFPCTPRHRDWVFGVLGFAFALVCVCLLWREFMCSLCMFVFAEYLLCFFQILTTNEEC